MKTRKRTICVGLLLAVALVLVGTASAGASHTPYTATETLVWAGEPGTEEGGQWTFPGGNIHIRGWAQRYRVEASDPRVTGWNNVVANANWDANWCGPGWGTFRVDVDDYEGYWEGTWTAEMTATGYTLHVVGEGRGELAGLKVRATEVNGFMQGVILEPGGN